MVFAKKAKRFELMTAGDDHWAEYFDPFYFGLFVERIRTGDV